MKLFICAFWIVSNLAFGSIPDDPNDPLDAGPLFLILPPVADYPKPAHDLPVGKALILVFGQIWGLLNAVEAETT